MLSLQRKTTIPDPANQLCSGSESLRPERAHGGFISDPWLTLVIAKECRKIYRRTNKRTNGQTDRQAESRLASFQIVVVACERTELYCLYYAQLLWRPHATLDRLCFHYGRRSLQKFRWKIARKRRRRPYGIATVFPLWFPVWKIFHIPLRLRQDVLLTYLLTYCFQSTSEAGIFCCIWELELFGYCMTWCLFSVH